MKKSLLLLLLLCWGCDQRQPAYQYEFHTGVQGALLWRCNRFSGEVDYCDATTRTWHGIQTDYDELSREFNKLTNALAHPKP